MLHCITFSVNAGKNNNPQFPDFAEPVSSGPFVSKFHFTERQGHYSEKWKQYIKMEILKPVNFAGHYRVILSKNGTSPQGCGNDGWVCGWIIDKLTGKIVSELPAFNNNTKYYSTIDNVTPSPDYFDAEYYPNSTMIWISGQNRPEKAKDLRSRCANSAYDFKNDRLIKLVSSRCEVDTGSDENVDKYLP